MKSASPEPQKAARPSNPESSQDTLYAARKKLYVRSVTGLFANWRWALVWITQILFYGLPWLSWNDRQAVLFHLTERKFYIFGWVFWPQDVFFLAILLIISAYALFFFTAIAGRLWCGYACPQTVYTEIFMWIEEKVGVNPYKLGMIGSTDSHTGLSSYEEDNFWGKLAFDSATLGELVGLMESRIDELSA